MPKYSGTVIEAQPDWLTLSIHNPTGVERMGALATILQDAELAAGNRKRKFQMMGYVGTIVGRVAYGTRDVGAGELRLSGDMAALAFDEAVPLADRISRMDIAVTWRSDTPMPKLGMRDLVAAKKYHAAHPTSAKPGYRGDSEGGFTLYLGDRGSEYFFREYNKEAEERSTAGKDYDGRYDNCWRFEVEMKSSIPWLVMKRMLAAPDRDAFCQGYVHQYMTRHGLVPPFDAAGGQALVPGFRRKSDAESKLNHLTKNVRPTVAWLTKNGRLDDVRKALGLEDG